MLVARPHKPTLAPPVSFATFMSALRVRIVVHRVGVDFQAARVPARNGNDWAERLAAQGVAESAQKREGEIYRERHAFLLRARLCRFPGCARALESAGDLP